MKADFSQQLHVLDGFEKRQVVSAEFVQLFQWKVLTAYPFVQLLGCALCWRGLPRRAETILKLACVFDVD